MRRWGIVVTLFYLAVVLFLLHPLGAALLLEEPRSGITKWLPALATVPLWWIVLAILVGGQALLLFLSVDSSRRHLRPRQHVAATACLAGALTALLAFAVIWAIAVGLDGDKALEWQFSPFRGKDSEVEIRIAAWWAALWIAWGVVFYLYHRSSSAIVSRRAW